MATSRVWDEEYRKRIERHQRDRGPQWTNIEEEKALSKHHLQGRVIVIDCVTLWGTNFFFDQDSNVDLALQELKEEFDRFTAQEATFTFTPIPETISTTSSAFSAMYLFTQPCISVNRRWMVFSATPPIPISLVTKIKG